MIIIKFSKYSILIFLYSVIPFKKKNNKVSTVSSYLGKSLTNFKVNLNTSVFNLNFVLSKILLCENKYNPMNSGKLALNLIPHLILLTHKATCVEIMV